MATVPRRPLAFPAAVAVAATAGVFAASRWLPADDPVDFEVRWTARVMFALWAVAAARRIATGRTPVTRAWWTVACVSFVVHVAVAFDRYHGWSHANAFAHVEATAGFGPGIFVSYLFTMLWVADAASWWLAPTAYATRATWKEVALHGFFAFVMFNGTVVYEPGFIRWAGLAVFAGLGVMVIANGRSRRPAT